MHIRLIRLTQINAFYIFTITRTHYAYDTGIKLNIHMYVWYVFDSSIKLIIIILWFVKHVQIVHRNENFLNERATSIIIPRREYYYFIKNKIFRICFSTKSFL